jgi:hypothetical protein
MKPLRKNIGLLILSVTALIVSAALMAGCINLIASEEDDNSYTPPQGMGAVLFSFGDSSARTLMPDHVNIKQFGSIDLTFDDFDSFYETFTVYPADDFDDDGYFTIELPPGDYQLEITGHIRSPGSMGAYAVTGDGSGSIRLDNKNGPYADKIPIKENKITEVYVQLRAENSLYGGGYFAWDIENELGHNYFLMKITLTSFSNDDFGPLVLGPNLRNIMGVNINECGYYYVDFELTIFDENNVPIGTFENRNVAHIYYSMTTTFRYTLTNNLVVPPH